MVLADKLAPSRKSLRSSSETNNIVVISDKLVDGLSAEWLCCRQSLAAITGGA